VQKPAWRDHAAVLRLVLSRHLAYLKAHHHHPGSPELHRPATERCNRFSNSITRWLTRSVNRWAAAMGGLEFTDANNRFSWDPVHNNFAPRPAFPSS
jgi:hypothetical protein